MQTMLFSPTLALNKARHAILQGKAQQAYNQRKRLLYIFYNNSFI